MNNYTHSFLEETMNVDELYEGSSKLAASYQNGIIYLFSSNVGFIAKQFCNKKLLPDIEISNLDSIILDPSRIEFAPKEIQIQSFKQIYLVKYVPGGTMLNVKTNIEQPTINYDYPVIIVKAFSRKQTAWLSVEENILLCKSCELLENSEDIVSSSIVRLPDDLRDAVCGELQRRMMNNYLLYAPSFPEVLRSVGIEDYREYAYSVEQFVNLYLGPNYKFVKNIEIGGKRHPGVILYLDGRQEDDVIASIGTDSKTASQSKQTPLQLDDEIWDKVKIALKDAAKDKGWILSSAVPKILEECGIDDFHKYSASIKDFALKYLMDIFKYESMSVIDGKKHPGVLFLANKNTANNISTIEIMFDDPLLAEYKTGASEALFGVINICNNYVGYINAEYVDRKVYPDYVLDSAKSSKFDTSAINWQPTNIEIDTQKEIYLVAYHVNGTIINPKTQQVQPAVDYSHPVSVIKAFPRKQYPRISVQDDRVICEQYVQEKFEIGSFESVIDAIQKEISRRLMTQKYVLASMLPEIAKSAGMPNFRAYADNVEGFINTYLLEYTLLKHIEIEGTLYPGIIIKRGDEEYFLEKNNEHTITDDPTSANESDFALLDKLFEEKNYFSLLTGEILQRVSFCALPFSYMERVLTCAARILYGDDRVVVLNEFQKEVIVAPIPIAFIKKWKKDGRFPEAIINDCANTSIASFDLPNDNGRVVALINKIGYSNSHNDNYAGLIDRFSVCSNSLTPLFYFIRFCVQSNKVVAGLSEYCQLAKDINTAFDDRTEDEYRLYSFGKLLLAVNSYIVKLQDLPRNLRTHIFSVYFDAGSFSELEEILRVIDPEGISVETKLLSICNDFEECTESDIEWLLNHSVNLQLLQKTFSIVWEKYANRDTLPSHFLEMLNGIALYHDYTSVNEVLRFHITNNKFTKYEKQMQLMASFEMVCKIAEHRPEMFLLASYIANMAMSRNEDCAIDIVDKWPAISDSLFANILLQNKGITAKEDSTARTYFRILSLDVDKYLVAQNKYADWFSEQCMVSERTTDEVRNLLDELSKKEAYEAYSRLFWDVYHRLDVSSVDILFIEQYVVALVGLRKFAEAVAFVNSENQFSLEKRSELLINVMTENFRINGLYQKAFSIFNSDFTTNDAIVLLQDNIFPTKYNIFTCLIALYCNEKRYEKALYLYHIYHSKIENGFADVYSQLRGKTSSVYGKLKNRYDVIELAFNALNREDLVEFLTWVKLIPIPDFKGEAATHPLSFFFDKLVAAPHDSSIWLDFIAHMSRNIDKNSWMIVVCDCILRHEFGISYSKADVHTAIRNVVATADAKEHPYNLLPYIFIYIEDHMDVTIGQNIIVRLADEKLQKKLIHNNYWYESYQKEYNNFKSHCLEQFSKTGNSIYNDFLRNLGLELDMSDLIHLAESSADKSFVFQKICNNYMMGLYPSETVAILNAFDVNKLSQRDVGVLSVLKMLYKDDDLLLTSDLSILENEDRIRRFKYDCAKIISVFPQKKELYSFEDANSDKFYKMVLYAHVFEFLYSEDIYDKYNFDFGELYADRRLFGAYLYFIKSTYNAQLIWNTGYWFFYKRWRYLKWAIAECLSDGRNYSDANVIEAMKSNDHFDMVFDIDYKPFRRKLIEFCDIESISDKVKKFFLYALMTGNYEEFLSQNAHVLSLLSDSDKALFRDMVYQLDFRKFNLELYRKFEHNFLNNEYEEALSVAGAVSLYAFDAINALKKSANREKAYSLFSAISLTEKESEVAATVLSLDDTVYSEYADMLLPLLCSRQFDFSIYRNIRRSLLANARKIGDVKYQLLGDYLEKYHPIEANAVRWHLAALKSALLKDHEKVKHIVREHDIATGVPVEWAKETNNIIDFATGKTDKFSRDYSAQDDSLMGKKKEQPFSFVHKLAVVFGVKKESISPQEANTLYQRFSDKSLTMWDRIQSGLTLALNYRLDNKSKEQNSHDMPSKRVLSFQVGMALIGSAIDISLDDRLLVLTEVYNARKLIQKEEQEESLAQLRETYSTTIKRGLSLTNWFTYAEAINQFLVDTHALLDFGELRSRIIEPAASLFDEMVPVEERYTKLKSLLGASRGLESPYAESVFDAIRRECCAIENGPRLSINIENDIITDGQLYVVIENIGTCAVDIQGEGFAIVLHQAGHPKRENIEVADVGRLQRNSLTGGHVALVLDKEETQIEASLYICKKSGEKTIVLCSVTKNLRVGHSSTEFSVKSTTKYDVDKAVMGSEILFGREDIKEKLAAIIPNGIAVIYGPSRIGKTSLMNWIQDSYAYDKGNIISISFGAEGGNGKETDYQENFIEASKPIPYDNDAAMSEYLLVNTIEAGLGKLFRYSKPSRKQFTRDTRSQIINILQDESMGIMEKYNELDEFLGEEGLELWLMLDEFQQVVERWNIKKTSDFVRICQRISYIKSSNIKIIFCGSDDLLRHMVLKYDSVWQDTFNPSCRVAVGPLDSEPFKEMIRTEKSLCGSNVIYSEDAQRALYSYTGGVALYGKEICNTILTEIYLKPTLYSGRHQIYVSDIATKTQELLRTQAYSLSAKDSVGIVEIYRAVTKNLDPNSDMQYLWHIAKWINTNPDQEGFTENDFSKEGVLKNPKQMQDLLEIAVERGILRTHVSHVDGQTYYNFRTIFYYYAILGRSKEYNRDLIFAEIDDELELEKKKSKTQEILDSFRSLTNPDDQSEVLGAMYHSLNLDSRVRDTFREGIGVHYTYGGDDNRGGTKIGEQHNVQVNVQTISNTLNGILATGATPATMLAGLKDLPRLASYISETDLPMLLEGIDSEDPETVFEAEAKLEEKTSQMAADYKAALVMKEDVTEVFCVWDILGITEDEYLMLTDKLDPSFMTDLYFAAKLDSIFSRIEQDEDGQDTKDYSPVSIMYCKILEKMLKFYHTDIYCRRVPRVSTEVKLNGSKVWFGDLVDTSIRAVVQNKIMLGAFLYPINPECIDDNHRNWEKIANSSRMSKQQVWKNHAQMLHRAKAIRNSSAHGADGVLVDRNMLNELKNLLLNHEGLLTIVELSK